MKKKKGKIIDDVRLKKGGVDSLLSEARDRLENFKQYLSKRKEEKEKILIQLSKAELRLILYWRNVCHNQNNNCPLHCLKEGVIFCHNCTEYLETYKKDGK